MMEHIMLYIRRILFMVRKEMLTTLKDPKSRIILIMPVIIQSLLFGYVRILRREIWRGHNKAVF